MTDLFQGDPALSIDADGASLTFQGGQPVMDQGVENQALISLFTAAGWPGNYLLETEIGSDFETIAQGPITLSSLTQLEKAGEAALESPLFGAIQVQASNPTAEQLNVSVLISPQQTILLTRNGQTWINQASK